MVRPCQRCPRAHSPAKRVKKTNNTVSVWQTVKRARVQQQQQQRRQWSQCSQGCTSYCVRLTLRVRRRDVTWHDALGLTVHFPACIRPHPSSSKRIVRYVGFNEQSLPERESQFLSNFVINHRIHHSWLPRHQETNRNPDHKVWWDSTHEPNSFKT